MFVVSAAEEAEELSKEPKALVEEEAVDDHKLDASFLDSPFRTPFSDVDFDDFAAVSSSSSSSSSSPPSFPPPKIDERPDPPPNVGGWRTKDDVGAPFPELDEAEDPLVPPPLPQFTVKGSRAEGRSKGLAAGAGLWSAAANLDSEKGEECLAAPNSDAPEEEEEGEVEAKGEGLVGKASLGAAKAALFVDGLAVDGAVVPDEAVLGEEFVHAESGFLSGEVDPILAGVETPFSVVGAASRRVASPTPPLAALPKLRVGGWRIDGRSVGPSALEEAVVEVESAAPSFGSSTSSAGVVEDTTPVESPSPEAPPKGLAGAVASTPAPPKGLEGTAFKGGATAAMERAGGGSSTTVDLGTEWPNISSDDICGCSTSSSSSSSASSCFEFPAASSPPGANLELRLTVEPVVEGKSGAGFRVAEDNFLIGLMMGAPAADMAVGTLSASSPADRTRSAMF